MSHAITMDHTALVLDPPIHRSTIMTQISFMAAPAIPIRDIDLNHPPDCKIALRMIPYRLKMIVVPIITIHRT